MKQPHRSRFSGPLLAFVAAIAGAAVGYGAARWQGHGEAQQLRAQLADTQAEATAQRESAAAALRDARATHEAAEQALKRQIGVLEGRRRLHLSLEALDDRNFGIAQRLLQEAARLLADNTGNRAELAELAQSVSEARVVAAANIQNQRELIRSFVRRLEELLPPVDLGPLIRPSAPPAAEGTTSE